MFRVSIILLLLNVDCQAICYLFSNILFYVFCCGKRKMRGLNFYLKEDSPSFQLLSFLHCVSHSRIPTLPMTGGWRGLSWLVLNGF